MCFRGHVETGAMVQAAAWMLKQVQHDDEMVLVH